ncbi:hypothetical protein BST29_19815 [Mycobacterium malmoense]|uniref:Uncharacterized protein n=1 Tax=Mycobacterium malmoense TaxID=1780 RepID=A0ABX3SMA2_MYCMA|nr:hypothetical protein BMG05_07875 [Mycobacterium malmoense]ORA79102.1 hypothetical protein BST29_19815 [Mycobacterium malmoense]
MVIRAARADPMIALRSIICWPFRGCICGVETDRRCRCWRGAMPERHGRALGAVADHAGGMNSPPNDRVCTICAETADCDASS